MPHKSDEKLDKPLGEKELKEAVANITISNFKTTSKNSLSGPIQLGNVKD